MNLSKLTNSVRARAWRDGDDSVKWADMGRREKNKNRPVALAENTYELLFELNWVYLRAD